MGETVLNIGQLILGGGPLIFPILACSLIACAITIERLFFFSSINSNVDTFQQSIFEKVRDSQLKDALELCHANPSPVATIYKAGILKYGYPKDALKDAITEAARQILPQLERNLHALSTIAHIAPLLGLLGTIVGIAQCFYTIKLAENQLTPMTIGDFSAGIGQALITTAAGLIVAIPTLVAYNYLLSQANSFILKFELSSTELLDFLSNLFETQRPTIPEQGNTLL